MKPFHIPPITSDLGTAYGLPLAGAALAAEAFVLLLNAIAVADLFGIAVGTWDLGQDNNNVGSHLTIETVVSVIVVGIQLLIGMLGFFSISFRWPLGIRLLNPGYKILFVGAATSIISDVLVWILGAAGVGARPFTNECQVISAVVLTSGRLVLIATSWLTMSCFRSLAFVVVNGGSGWERLNYSEIHAKRLTETYYGHEADEDDDLLSYGTPLSGFDKDPLNSGGRLGSYMDRIDIRHFPYPIEEVYYQNSATTDISNQ